ncbi:MAG: hypothetical protein AVDCRST_MAG04-443, partial [uncultured Acetobacteraceae bacterium]
GAPSDGFLLLRLWRPALPSGLAAHARHLRRLRHRQRGPGGRRFPHRPGHRQLGRGESGRSAAARSRAARLRALRGRGGGFRAAVQIFPLRPVGGGAGGRGGRPGGRVRVVLRGDGAAHRPDGRVLAAAGAGGGDLARHGGRADRLALRAEHARRRGRGAGGRLAAGRQRRLRGHPPRRRRARHRRRADRAQPVARPARPSGAGPGPDRRPRRDRTGSGGALRRAAALVRAGVPVGLRGRRPGDPVGAAAGAGRAVPRLPVPHRARRVPAGRRRRHRLRVAAGPAPARPAPRLLPGAKRRLRAGRGADPGALAGAPALAAPELPPGGPVAARGAVVPRHHRADGPRRRAALLPDRHDLPARAAGGAARPGEGGRAGRLGAARQHRRQRRRVIGHGARVPALPGHRRDAAAAGGAFPGPVAGVAVARRRPVAAARAGAGAGRGLRRRGGGRAVQRGVLEPHARPAAGGGDGLGRGPLRHRLLARRPARPAAAARALLHHGLQPRQHPVLVLPHAARRRRPVAAPGPAAGARDRRRQRRQPLGRHGLAGDARGAGRGDRRAGPERARRHRPAAARGRGGGAARRPARPVGARRRAPGAGARRRALRRDPGGRRAAAQFAQRAALQPRVPGGGAPSPRPRRALRAVGAEPPRGRNLRRGVPARGAPAAGQHARRQRSADCRRGAPPRRAARRPGRRRAPRARQRRRRIRELRSAGRGRAGDRLEPGGPARARAADRHVPARRVLREQRPRRGRADRGTGAAGRRRRAL